MWKDFGREPAPGALAPGAGSLPCLRHHKCNGSALDGSKVRVFSRGKSARHLKEAILQIAARYGLHRMGVLTLSFANPQPGSRLELQRRLHSLVTGVLNPRYLLGVTVVERSDRGHLNVHVVVVLRASASLYERSGGTVVSGAIIHADVKARRWGCVPVNLRKEWAFWRAVAPKYGFYRPEFLPPKGKANWIAAYLANYVSKGGQAIFGQERVRRVRYFGKDSFNCGRGGARMYVDRFTSVWRASVKMWAESRGCYSLDAVRLKFGSRWYWKHKDEIVYYRVFVESSEKDVLKCPSKSPSLVKSVRPVGRARNPVFPSPVGVLVLPKRLKGRAGWKALHERFDRRL